MSSCEVLLTLKPQMRPLHSLVEHPHAISLSKISLNGHMMNKQPAYSRIDAVNWSMARIFWAMVSQGWHRIFFVSYSKKKLSPYSLPSSALVIPTTRLFTVTDAPVSRATVILVVHILRSTCMSFFYLVTDVEKNCLPPHNQQGHEVTNRLSLPSSRWWCIPHY